MSRAIGVSALRALLADERLRDDDTLLPNVAGNLAVLRDSTYVGYVELRAHEVVLLDEETPDAAASEPGFTPLGRTDLIVTVTDRSGAVLFIGRPASTGDVLMIVREEGKPMRLTASVPDLTASADSEPPLRRDSRGNLVLDAEPGMPS